MDDVEYRLLVTGVFPREVADALKQGIKQSSIKH
jgi:hypothetical protein